MLLKNYQKVKSPFTEVLENCLHLTVVADSARSRRGISETERRCQSLVYNQGVSDNREKSLKPYVIRCLLPLFLWKMLKTHPTETESDTRSHFIRLLANLYFVKHDTCWPKHSVWIRFWQSFQFTIYFISDLKANLQIA